MQNVSKCCTFSKIGKGWTIEEFVIVSEHDSKHYYKCKFKIDDKGQFNPTKAATGTMDSFYKGCEKALKEHGFSRSANAVAKKEPEWMNWTRAYKHAIEKSGGDSVVGRRYSFVPIANQDADEDKCVVIMENFYSAFGNSPKVEPEVVQSFAGNSAKPSVRPPPLSANEINLKLVDSLGVLVSSISKESNLQPALSTSTTSSTNRNLELDELIKKSQINSELKADGMENEIALKISGLQ